MYDPTELKKLFNLNNQSFKLMLILKICNDEYSYRRKVLLKNIFIYIKNKLHSNARYKSKYSFNIFKHIKLNNSV